MKGTMKKTTRRVVSVVLALAMIFTSINYVPSVNANAAEGWTEITGVKYQADGSAMTLNYKVAKGSEG